MVNDVLQAVDFHKAAKSPHTIEQTIKFSPHVCLVNVKAHHQAQASCGIHGCPIHFQKTPSLATHQGSVLVAPSARLSGNSIGDIGVRGS